MTSPREGEPTPRTVVLVAIADFDLWLSSLGKTLTDFLDEMMGSWIFSYVEALTAAGVRPVMVITSPEVRGMTRALHVPTQCLVYVLPESLLFRWVRKLIPTRLEPLRIRHKPSVVSRLLRAVAQKVAGVVAPRPLLLWRLFRREKADVALVQGYQSPLFMVCVAIGRLLRLPVYGVYTSEPRTLPVTWPLRVLALRASSGVLVAATAEKERLAHIYNSSVRPIDIAFHVDRRIWYPGDREEARRKLNLPLDADIVAFHGAILLYYKGLDILVDAYRTLLTTATRRPCALLVIGGGPDAPRFRDLIQAAGGTVIWNDSWIDDRATIREYLTAADVYAFPSRCDGFPMSVLEAMACGLPVVGSRVNGIADMLAGGEESGGIVVPPEDAATLAAAIRSLLDDDERRSRVARAALTRVRSEYDVGVIGKRLEATLR